MDEEVPESMSPMEMFDGLEKVVEVLMNIEAHFVSRGYEPSDARRLAVFMLTQRS